MDKKKVLIGSPICQKSNILSEYLNSLLNLNSELFNADYFFIDDNKDTQSKEVINRFSPANSKVYILENNEQQEYLCTEQTHHWNDNLIWKVANFKNIIIDKAIKNKYDFLFLIDSDILLHPNTINNLIKQEKDIISEIFWTKWQPNYPLLPQVWLYDSYTMYEYEPNLEREEIQRRQLEFLNYLQTPGVYEVGGLGACTLISRKALEKGVNFSRIKNLTFWGEDRHFCIRAAAMGINLFVDTNYPAFHIYRESELENVQEFKEKVNYKEYLSREKEMNRSYEVNNETNDQRITNCIYDILNKKNLHQNCDALNEINFDCVISNIKKNFNNNIEVMNLLAIVNYELGKYDYVLPYFYEAIKLDKADNDTLFNMAFFLFKLGEKELALEYLSQMINTDSEYQKLYNDILKL